MRVLNISPEELKVIEASLKSMEHAYSVILKEQEGAKDKEDCESSLLQVRSIRKRLQDQSLQELVERILGNYWDMYQEMGWLCDDILELADDMGIDEREMLELFHVAGFEED